MYVWQVAIDWLNETF